MKILAILLIPLFLGIVLATPTFKEIHSIKDTLENHDNQQNHIENLNLIDSITNKSKFEENDTRSEHWKGSLFPLFQKNRKNSTDKEIIEDNVNPKGILLNGLNIGKQIVDDIIQTISSILYKFNNDIFNNKNHDRQKRESTKLRNVTEYTFNLQLNIKKIKYQKPYPMLKMRGREKIIDQEALHSIIPQITVNNNQRSSISRNNELFKKIDNNGFEIKRKQLYTEADNMKRNKRGIHKPLCNNNHNKEAVKLNDFHINVQDGEFTKWLDNTPEYYFDYSEPLDISSKYTPPPPPSSPPPLSPPSIATNVKVISSKTVLDKTPDKLAPIKTYFQSDYDDSHSKWINDKEFEYYTDLKKSPLMWQSYAAAVDETITLPSEWNINDKTMNDNNNFKANYKDVHIPSDWIVKYKMMNDTSDDILFYKVGSHNGDNVETNSRIGVVREDRNKPLNNVIEAKSDKDDHVSKSAQLKSIETTSRSETVNANQQKLSTLDVKDIIASGKTDTTVAAESTTFNKSNAGDIAINELKDNQTEWNTTAIVSDKNAFISDDKAAAASNENEIELSRFSIKNNTFSNQSNNISDIKINIKDIIGYNETIDQRENNNEQSTKTITENILSSDKNNSTELKGVILPKAVDSGTGIPHSIENSDTHEIHVPPEWIVNYKRLDDKDYYSKLVITGNSNVSNSETIEDSYKLTNWTNEPKVTREPDDKWPSLKANEKTSAVQATLVSTEKIENLLNRRDEETKVSSLKYLTDKDETISSVATAHSNLDKSTMKKQISWNSNEDEKLFDRKDNKVIESTRVDTKTAVITDEENNKQKLDFDKNEKVFDVNIQLVASDAGNAKTVGESEKEQRKWNDGGQNLIVQNDTTLNNKVSVSDEANPYTTAVTDNNKQTLEKVKSIKYNDTLNNQTITAITIANDNHISKSDAKYNDSALDNKLITFSTSNVDTTTTTDDGNQEWRWNNEETSEIIKDNGNLNNKTAILSEGNSKVATSATDDRKVSGIIQSKETEWKLGKNTSELSILNDDISNIEKTTTVKNDYDVEQVESDKKISWISGEKEEKYNITLDNEQVTTVRAYLTATTTENDKQKWNWDNEVKDSNVKDKLLLNNLTEVSALADNVTVTDNRSKINQGIERIILNDQNIIASNNSDILSLETNITSLPIFKYDNLEWDWDNKDSNLSVRNNDKSNSEIDSFDEVNSNTAKSSASNKDTWKWISEGKVSSNKSNYLTANKTDLSSVASVEVSETTENSKLFNYNDKDEYSSEKKIISNSKADALSSASSNSQSVTKNNKKEWIESQNVKDYIIYNNKIAELNKINVKDSSNITHDNSQSKLEEKGNYLNVTNDVKSDQTVESVEKNIDFTTALEKNKYGSDNNKKTEKINDDFILNDAAAAASAASNSDATSTIVNDNKISWLENESNNLNTKINHTINNEAVEIIKDNTDAGEGLENNKKQRESSNDNITQDVNDQLVINNQAAATAASDANATATMASKKQEFKSDDKNNNSKINNNVTLNNNATESTEIKTDDKVVDKNNKKQFQSNENRNFNIENDFSINEQVVATAASKANATTILASDKQKLKSDDTNNDSSIKNNTSLNNKEIVESTKANIDVTAILEDSKKKQQKSDNNNNNNNNNKNFSVKDGFTIDDQVTANAASDANATATIIKNKQQSKLDENNNNLDVRNDTESNFKVIWFADDNKDVTAISENNEKQQELDNNNNKSQSMKDYLKNINDQSKAFAESNSNSILTNTRDIQQSISNNENNDSSIQQNVTLSDKVFVSTDAITDDTSSFEKIMKQWSLVDNENQNVKESTTFDSSNVANSLSTIANNNQQSNSNNYDNYSSIKNNVTSNNTAISFSEGSIDIAAAGKNNQNQSKSDNKKTQSIKDNLVINNSNVSSAESNANAASTIVLGKVQPRLNNEVYDSSIKKNKSLNKIEIDSSEVSTEAEISTENHKQQLKLNNKSNDSSIRNDFTSSNNKDFESVETNSNVKIITENDKKEEFQIKEKDVVSKSQAAVSSVEKNQNTNNNVSSNNKSSNSAKANADTATIISNDQQQLELNKKEEFQIEKDDVVSKSQAEKKQVNEEVDNYSLKNTIANVKANTSTIDEEMKIDSSYLDTEINKNSLKNTKASESTKSEMNSMKRIDDRRFDQNNYNKNLTNITNLRNAVKTKVEYNSISISKEENNSVTKETIDGKSDDLLIIPSKEIEIINNLDKSSSNFINWFLRWKSISDTVENNKNERQNNQEIINNGKIENSYDEKHTIDEIVPTVMLTDDKTKDTKKKIEQMDDADLIVIKKPYGQQDTIGVTYIKDSLPPMILFRMIPRSLFEQVRNLMKQFEIVRVSYTEPQI
ncbi:hypothetical protein M0802_012935 [Mischocyttarus mexicanus]|nr:hypothetical protein M0802_012935 [Mischocyttarus mexicanus]